MPSNRTKRKPNRWLLLLVASTTMLSACTNSTIKFCPAPVLPDNLTLAWIDKTPTPAYFDAWFDRYAKQQEFFKRGCV